MRLLELNNANIMDEFIVDEGSEFAPTVKEEKGEIEGSTSDSSSLPLKADSAEEVQEEKPSGETAAPSSEGKETSETEEESEDDSSQSLEDVLASVDKEIANEKNAAYFRNGLKTFKSAFLKETEAIKSLYKPLEDYGEVESIIENLEIVKGLDAYENDSNNLPIATVKPFVDALIEKRGNEKVVALMQEIGNRTSPLNANRTYFDELIAAYGLDPARISDFKQFAKNGYQVGVNNAPDPEELELVPEGVREAFISLSPDERDEMFLLSEEARNRALKGIQNELDFNRQQEEKKLSDAETQAQEKIQQQQQFYQAVNERTFELVDSSGSRLYTSFTESLVNADIDEIDAIGIANTVSMVLNAEGVEAKTSRERLEKAGIKIDDSLLSTFKQWQEAAHRTAVFEKQNNEAEYKKSLAEFESLETKLIRKANPIIAGLLGRKAEQTKSSVSSRNSKLTQTLNHNNGIGNQGRQEGINSGSQPITDFSESAYLASEF